MAGGIPQKPCVAFWGRKFLHMSGAFCNGYLHVGHYLMQPQHIVTHTQTSSQFSTESAIAGRGLIVDSFAPVAAATTDGRTGPNPALIRT
jgi:hypothetical protein